MASIAVIGTEPLGRGPAGRGGQTVRFHEYHRHSDLSIIKTAYISLQK